MKLPIFGATSVKWEYTRPKTSPDAVIRDEGGCALVFLPDSDRILAVNETGMVILRLLDGSRSVEDIAILLAKHFDTTPDEAKKDLTVYLDDLDKQGVLCGP